MVERNGFQPETVLINLSQFHEGFNQFEMDKWVIFYLWADL